MKRILTIQDISCVGKCSLTVALPIISAAGVEAAILPTAVLSTHTMFSNFTCKDLDDQIEPIAQHWLSENIDFDAIYTGYLATADQIAKVAKIFDDFKTDNSVTIVDPAMADNGKMYPAFDESFAGEMAKLCGKADFILPNITEAAFMTGMEYKETYDRAYIEEMLHKLADLGAKICILTGVSFQEGTTGVMGYNSENGEFYYYTNKLIDAMFHGTGDVFASSFTGAMMNGMTWQEAIPVAADYTAKSIEITLQDPKKPWYGVNFEEAIPYYIDRLNK